MNRIISIGELLWDILPDKTILGGALANLAFRLKELGNESCLVSRLGEDQLGFKASKQLELLKLSNKFIQWDTEYPTGTVDVSFDEHKNPDYIINPGVAYDYIELTTELQEYAKNADCLAFGTLAQRSPKTRQTILDLLDSSKSKIRFLDINLRKKCYTKETVFNSLKHANVLKLNHHEAHELANMFEFKASGISEIAEIASARFELETVLVTMEEYGVFCYNINEGKEYVPGYKIKLMDPLGAGDAFSAGFIDSILKGMSTKEACEAGNKLGAFVATQKGATQQASAEEINATLKNCSRIVDESCSKFMNITIA